MTVLLTTQLPHQREVQELFFVWSTSIDKDFSAAAMGGFELSLTSLNRNSNNLIQNIFSTTHNIFTCNFCCYGLPFNTYYVKQNVI